MASDSFEFYFEDFSVGQILPTTSRVLEREELLEFARSYDPQPFHLDDQAARRSILGGLAASGWHSACLMMRMNCDGWLTRTASHGTAGIEEVTWRSPLRPGDQLRVRTEVVGTAPAEARPGAGKVELTSDLINGRDEVVASQRNWIFVQTRNGTPMPADPPAARPVAPPFNAETGCAWYEDAEIGRSYQLGHFCFDAETIVDFAKKYDPQRFHLEHQPLNWNQLSDKLMRKNNELEHYPDSKKQGNALDAEAGRAGLFAGLSASGLHSCCIWMRKVVDAKIAFAAQEEAAGRPIPPFGPSPGIKNLQWPAPVLAGDEISFDTTFLDKRLVSRPGWGLLSTRNRAFNTLGEMVMTFDAAVFFPLRSA